MRHNRFTSRDGDHIMVAKKKNTDLSPFGRVSALLDRSLDAFVSLSGELVARNAVGPASGGPGETEKADFLATWLLNEGFPQPVRLTAMDGEVPRPNLFTRVPGKDHSQCLWIMNHLDVVPAGDMDLWKSDPFVMRVEGDKLIGRGVEDNHQGIVCAVMALKALMSEGIEPACDVGLLFVADEETGSKWGIRWLLENHADIFGPKDVFLVPDAGNEDGSMVEIAEKAILWLRFRVQGKQVHASTPNLGKNAFTAASHLVVKLRTLYDRFDLRDPIFDPPMSTFEATKKEPNVANINTIPGDDVFYVDCRILPQTSVEEVLAHIRGMCEDIARQQRVVIQFETVQREDAALPTPIDAPVVRHVIDAVRRVYGVEAKPKGIGGGTVAANLRKAGYPAVVWGRMDDTAHQPNEYVWVQNLIGDAKVFADIMIGCGAGPSKEEDKS